MALLEEAEADVQEGRAKPVDEFLAGARVKRNRSKSQPGEEASGYPLSG
jgi:hypothetical protein